uniref:LOW QUALITY PROTEIN: polyhomeotic-like protein 2-like n=1 Tax=Saccoglossus kowalevskii TaxID=10224 RepID=A0ABM0MIR8_SACKO|nr:PREDICTED: LOW QUALITY PROTEIN: polyhomeotic-like protein 2-like [Saccoglossus kowalevskii]
MGKCPPPVSPNGATGTTSCPLLNPHLTVSAVASAGRPHIPVQLCPDRQVQVIQRPFSAPQYGVATQLFAHQPVLLQGLPHGTIAVPQQQMQGMASPPLPSRSPTTSQPGMQPNITMLQHVVPSTPPLNLVSGSCSTTIANLTTSTSSVGSLNALTATVNALQPMVSSVPYSIAGNQPGKLMTKAMGGMVISTHSPTSPSHVPSVGKVMGRHAGMQFSHKESKQQVIITTTTPIFVRPQRQPTTVTTHPPIQTVTVAATPSFTRHNMVMVSPQTSVRHVHPSHHGIPKQQQQQQLQQQQQQLQQQQQQLQQLQQQQQQLQHLHQQQQIAAAPKHLAHSHHMQKSSHSHLARQHASTTLTIPNPAKFIKVEKPSDLKYRQSHSSAGKHHKRPEPTKVHPQRQPPPLLHLQPKSPPVLQQQSNPTQPMMAQQSPVMENVDAQPPNRPKSVPQLELSVVSIQENNHGNKEQEEDNSKDPILTKEPSKEKEPQRAIVRPQVLTHVIEGFVIEEAKEPFPVSRSALIFDLNSSKKTTSSVSSDQESINIERRLDEHECEMGESSQMRDPIILKCEFCGKMDSATKFKRSKRFCSMACAKRYNVGCSKRLGLFKPSKPNKYKFNKHTKKMQMTFKAKGLRGKHGRLAFNIHEERPRQFDDDTGSSCQSESTPSPQTPPNYEDDFDDLDTDPIVVTDPKRWSVDEVFDFIRSLPGCSDYADEFKSQEIDGQALLLLKEDHLMSAMNMKLGPALKICARINSLKE